MVLSNAFASIIFPGGKKKKKEKKKNQTNIKYWYEHVRGEKNLRKDTSRCDDQYT